MILSPFIGLGFFFILMNNAITDPSSVSQALMDQLTAYILYPLFSGIILNIIGLFVLMGEGLGFKISNLRHSIYTKVETIFMIYIPFLIFLLIINNTFSKYPNLIFVALLNFFPFIIVIIPVILDIREFKYDSTFFGKGNRQQKIARGMLFVYLLIPFFLLIGIPTVEIFANIFEIISNTLHIMEHINWGGFHEFLFFDLRVYILGLIPFFFITNILLGYAAIITLQKYSHKKSKIFKILMIIPIITILSNSIPFQLFGISTNNLSIYSIYLTILFCIFDVLMWIFFILKHKLFPKGIENSGFILSLFLVLAIYIIIWPILTEFWVPLGDYFNYTIELKTFLDWLEFIEIGLFIYGIMWGIIIYKKQNEKKKFSEKYQSNFFDVIKEKTNQ